jgi:AGZA family xanthine/uracil permease-like MFS transporter
MMNDVPSPTGRDRGRRSNRMLERIDSYFKISEKGSTLRTEVLAGVSTFLVLSYIFVVNPAILAQAGMNRSAVLFATIAISGLSTIAMGLWARLPFVLAPGMEMNSYVAFYVVGALGYTWQQAFGAVFWSGILFILLTVTRVREQIIDAIPERMKVSLSLAVGVFLALIAFKLAGILTFSGVHVSGIGSITAPAAIAMYVGLSIALVLDRLRIRTAVLASILVATVVYRILGVGMQEKAAEVSRAMFSAVGKLDIGVILKPSALSVILVLFLIDFYGSVAKLIGLSGHTSIREGGRVPRMRQALLVDSIGTTAASLMGTSNITVYVESGVGIGAGGRTGITAVTCGILMLLCFAIAPFLHWVPLAATTGVLAFVAVKLCPSAKKLREFSRVDLLALVLMQACVVVTFALDRAIFVGLLVHVVGQLVRRERPAKYAVISILLLMAGVWLQ